jgi:hypothetical protein
MKAFKKYFFETAIPFLIWLGIILFAFWLEFSGSNRSSKKTAIEPICSSQLPSELAQCLAANAHSVDYSKILDSNTRILVFGEAHAAIAQKQEIVDHMQELANLGFTVLAYESMPSSKQYLITQYKAGTISREALSEEFRILWGYNPEPYVMIIDAALAAHMSIVFLDIDYEHIDLRKPNWAELERAANVRREAHWVNLMANICKSDKNAKIIALIGNAHVSSIQLQLSQHVIATKSISLDGGEFFYDTLVTEAARQSNLQDKRLIIKTAPVLGPNDSGAIVTDSNYHLQVPQSDHALIIGKRSKK